MSWVLVQLVDGSCFFSKWLTRWWKETFIELVCFSSVSRLFVRLIGHCFHCSLTRPFVPSFASSWSNPLFVHSFVCSCFRFLKIFGIRPCLVLRNFKHQNHYLRHKILARNFDNFFLPSLIGNYGLSSVLRAITECLSNNLHDNFKHMNLFLNFVFWWLYLFFQTRFYLFKLFANVRKRKFALLS